MKEADLSEHHKKETIKEFDFPKGIVVATFCGIMSACFAFALQAANPIASASAEAGTSELWTGLPKLVVLLLGGFTTNVVWCLLLNVKNRTSYEYLSSTQRTPDGGRVAIPRLNNYFFAGLAGTIWYLQFFFYTMGATQMGRYDFASWTLHMASIIIFGTLWGIYFREWQGTSAKVRAIIGLGILLLVTSTIVIGVGTWMKGPTTQPTAPMMDAEKAL
jgi:L-rhamnose-H+ transport protein